MRQWICINNEGYESELLLYKLYTEIDSNYADSFCIIITNELGIVSEYWQPLRFVSIGEWREIQLDKLI